MNWALILASALFYAVRLQRAQNVAERMFWLHLFFSLGISLSPWAHNHSLVINFVPIWYLLLHLPRKEGLIFLSALLHSHVLWVALPELFATRAEAFPYLFWPAILTQFIVFVGFYVVYRSGVWRTEFTAPEADLPVANSRAFR